MEIDRLNRMFSNLYNEHFGRSGWTPAVDIFESDDNEIVLKAELPEMKREDIGITFENQVLTIRGERKLDQQIKRDAYQRLERSYGAFSRAFTIPSTIDAGAISASYEDGLTREAAAARRGEAEEIQVTE